MSPRLAHAARRLARATLHRPGRLPWAIGAIAAALLAFAVVHLAARNVDAWTGTWTGEAAMVVYLDEEVGDERARALADELAGVGGVRAVEYVPAAEAARRLRVALGRHADILEGVDDGALPASLEIVLEPGVRDVAAASPIVDRLRGTRGVESVELVGDWVEQVGTVLAALRAGAWALLGLLGGLSIWVVAATARLRLADRGIAEEARVAELLGAPAGFARWPHVVAGALHGAVGGLVAVVGLWLVHRAVADDVTAALAGVMGDVDVAFLPPAELALVVFLGALLGLLGSALATGRRALA
jgi:cell division transport system permease protein